MDAMWPPLPAGVTGFREAGAPELPETDLRRFTGACHAAARAASLDVREVAEARPYTTYYTASLTSVRGDHIIVVCHRHVPWVAFAAPDDRVALRERFLSPPQWADQFTWVGFTVLAPDFLQARASLADMSALTSSDRHQVRYWKPATIGDIVFNDWD
ncbi:hypothetical protein [Streptomyces specialis]|uniref:hypothetical protein n=1 Tax=Streptomyces specialis TaxID=498367 RepID=UPI00073EAE41|nr:hypothetical protein [Streptomyces specialis]